MIFFVSWKRGFYVFLLLFCFQSGASQFNVEALQVELQCECGCKDIRDYRDACDH